MNDRQLIERLGGPARLAVLLGYNKRAGGVQRVHNWLSRGIPARVKLDRPDLFQEQAQASDVPEEVTQGN
jgi:hypothetical protein